MKINVEFSDDERTTKELILQLGSDVDRCHGELVDSFDVEGSDYEYHARQLIRAIFAYIEGVTFSVKVSSIRRCEKAGIDVSVFERFFAVEVGHELNDKGEVVQRDARIRLTSNIKFAFALVERSNGFPVHFDLSAEWWYCLKQSIRVRDRLTHPRLPQDLDVSGDEIITALKAKEGFSSTLVKYQDKKGKIK